jgi:hypothetical protein
MGGAEAEVEPGEAARLLTATIDSLTPERSGGFLRADGTRHPW